MFINISSIPYFIYSFHDDFMLICNKQKKEEEEFFADKDFFLGGGVDT